MIEWFMRDLFPFYLHVINGTVANTGHRSRPVAPTTIVTPARKGSVFEALILRNILDGAT